METKHGVFPYQYPINTAKEICKERYEAFRVLSRVPSLFFQNRDAYTLCYAYFRWFDNIVDSLKHSTQDIKHIVDRQKRFLSQLYSEKLPEELSTEELFLAHLVTFDKKFSKGMRADLETLIGTFEFDVKRRYKKINASALNDYISDNIVPYVNISLSIFDLDNYPKDAIYSVARAGFVIDYLTDLKKDIYLGYINIPVEEINSYGIEIDHLNSPPVKLWMKAKLGPLREIFENQKSVDFQPFLAKIAARYMIWKREIKLQNLVSYVS
jgi:phytoene/squalene synthetase